MNLRAAGNRVPSLAAKQIFLIDWNLPGLLIDFGDDEGEACAALEAPDEENHRRSRFSYYVGMCISLPFFSLTGLLLFSPHLHVSTVLWN